MLFAVGVSYLYSISSIVKGDFITSHLGKIEITVTTVDGKIFKVTIDSLGTVAQICQEFQENVRSDVPEIQTIVDVGAHVGIFTVYAASKFQLCKVIAVEPNPANYRLLLRNIDLNRLRNVVPIRAAITASEGHKQFWTSASSLGGSLTRRSRGSPITVLCRSLDSLLRENEALPSLLLKIDAESSELSILDGASDSLARTVLIVAEVDKANLPEVCAILSSKGFNIRIEEDDDAHFRISAGRKNANRQDCNLGEA
ncbi:MAG: hypothetical protein AUJ07_04420 [Crenarchaeota archaeon 13_1_40CM_3_53_5]|nr:MAG: hypothetical protein AUJ07_04420 [Crenarchaeota archaeon 13_1_40CM_3_53_5]